MPSLSLDHEFLTKDGWKLHVTADDELAVFGFPFRYVKPVGVDIYPCDRDMLFIDNERINIMAPCDLQVLGNGDGMRKSGTESGTECGTECSPDRSRCSWCFGDMVSRAAGVYHFTIVPNKADVVLEGLPYGVNILTCREEAEKLVDKAVMAGKSASMVYTKSCFENKKYMVRAYDTDVKFDTSDIDSYVFYMSGPKTDGMSIITVKMPKSEDGDQLPICVRRNGKICWVV